MGMDPATLGLASAGVSTVGNLVGGGKAAKSQNAAEQAAAQQQQQAMQMIQQYVQQAAPVVQSLVSGLFTGSNPYVQQQNQTISQLGNWQGLKPQEMNALTTNAANSGMSDIRTAQSQGAFGANQNAAIQSALDKNRQGADSAAVNVGSNAAGQELGALQSAGSLGGSLLNSVIGGIGSSLGLLSPSQTGVGNLSSMANANASTAASYGNPYQAATNSLGGGLAQLGSGKTASTPNTTTNTTTGQPYASNPVTNQGTGASVTGTGGQLIDAAGSGGYSTPYYGTGVPA